MSFENENLSVINLNDSNSITLFGADVQKTIAELSGRLLKSIEETETDNMTNMINRTVDCLNSFASEKDESKSIFNLFKKNNVHANENRRQDVIKHVESIETELDNFRVQLLMDSAMFDQLYKMNQECANTLQQKIDIIKMKKEEISRGDSQAMFGAGGVANNIGQIIDNRISDLELSLMLSVQQTAQIGMLRESTSSMAMRIQGTLYNIIPLWKNLICSNANSEIKTVGSGASEEIARANQSLISSLGEIAHVHEASKMKKREAGLVLGNKV